MIIVRSLFLTVLLWSKSTKTLHHNACSCHKEMTVILSLCVSCINAAPLWRTLSFEHGLTKKSALSYLSWFCISSESLSFFKCLSFGPSVFLSLSLNRKTLHPSCCFHCPPPPSLPPPLLSQPSSLPRPWRSPLAPLGRAVIIIM